MKKYPAYRGLEKKEVYILRIVEGRGTKMSRIDEIKILEDKIKRNQKDPLDELILDTDKEKLLWLKLEEEKRRHEDTEEHRAKLREEVLELQTKLRKFARMDEIENSLRYLERRLIRIFNLTGHEEEYFK
jgi:hypothetical protein